MADLLRHSLLRPTRIFDSPQREVQEAVRYRKSLVEMRGDEVRRLQKVLEGAKLRQTAPTRSRPHRCPRLLRNGTPPAWPSSPSAPQIRLPLASGRAGG